MEREIPTTKEQAFQPPLLDLRMGFPLRSTVPSFVYSLTTLPSSIGKFTIEEQQLHSIVPPLFFFNFLRKKKRERMNQPCVFFSTLK